MYQLDSLNIQELFVEDDSSIYLDIPIKIENQITAFRLIFTDKSCYILNMEIDSKPVNIKSFLFLKIPFEQTKNCRVEKEKVFIEFNGSKIGLIFENDDLSAEFGLASLL